jgi:hypothetical protein
VGEPQAELLEKFFRQERDPQELINEMAFRLRQGVSRQLSEGEREEGEAPMPPQDCSVLFFEVAKNVLRLAR